MNLLESEVTAIQQMPAHILEKFPLTEKTALTLRQLSEGLGLDDLPDGYIPRSVSFFINDLVQPIFELIGNEVIEIGIEFFTVKQPESAVLQIDNIPRYVEIGGVQQLCTLGGCALPEPLVRWQDRIDLLKQLLK